MRFRLVPLKAVAVQQQTVQALGQRLVVAPDEVRVDGAAATTGSRVVAAPFDFWHFSNCLKAFVDQRPVIGTFPRRLIDHRLVDALAALALASKAFGIIFKGFFYGKIVVRFLVLEKNLVLFCLPKILYATTARNRQRKSGLFIVGLILRLN